MSPLSRSSRASELRECLSGPLCKHLVEHLSDLVFVPAASIVLTGALNYAKAEHAAPVMEAVAEEACKPFSTGDQVGTKVEMEERRSFHEEHSYVSCSLLQEIESACLCFFFK